MWSIESLTDVEKGCVLSGGEQERRGAVKKERGIVCLQARYSTLQCYTRERAHHDCLAQREQARETGSVALLPLSE